MRVLLFARATTRCTKPHWEHHLCSVRRLFFELGAPGSCAVLDRTSGMWALPRVWRRKRFIVQRALVGDPVRIWIAHRQIAVGCFNPATSTLGGGAQTPQTWNRRMRTGVGPQRPVHWQASRQPSSGAGSEHKIGQECDKCSDGRCAMPGSECLAAR